MGRAAVPGCPVRPEAYEEVMPESDQVIMGRAVKLGCRYVATDSRIDRAGTHQRGAEGPAWRPARPARLGSPRGGTRTSTERRALGRVALVIMGRAHAAGYPFHDNGFFNRPSGHRQRGAAR